MPLTQLLPNDIGSAAAYEAYRTWKHNSFLHEPLSADRTQQREGLIGIAIAEGALPLPVSLPVRVSVTTCARVLM